LTFADPLSTWPDLPSDRPSSNLGWEGEKIDLDHSHFFKRGEEFDFCYFTSSQFSFLQRETALTLASNHQWCSGFEIRLVVWFFIWTCPL
jgi:hypothetical protein